MKSEIIRPGVVVIRNCLDNEEQERIIKIVEKHGGLKDDKGEWNFFGKRGRTFDALGNYPAEDEQFIKSCFKNMQSAIENNEEKSEIPVVGCTHILTWWYPDAKGMGWHQDGYGGNDGDKDAPVYSLTIGNGCIFDWRPIGEPNNAKESCVLKSGDVIVFGGPQRMMYHRVRKVLPNSFRDDFNVRINITFRKLDDFDEQVEKSFQTKEYVASLEKAWRNN